jgi:ribonucleoside-triphosphate reductase
MSNDIYTPSLRAQIITRRTYNRPKDDVGTIFETWSETIGRVLNHQRWLWERQQGNILNTEQNAELEELRALMEDRKALLSGRVLWLGGTEIAKRREASMHNCSFSHIETIHDAVDAFWNLLQGCGVGFRPIVGNLNGFTKPVKEIKVVRSTLTVQDWEDGYRGREKNEERIIKAHGETTWVLQVGDSAEAWAKSIGKMLAMKTPVDRVVLDFSDIRSGGIRLKGYGWISSGDTTVSVAFKAIAQLLSDRAGKLLTRMDILDIMNHLGTTLSSRRSAEIGMLGYGEPEWEDFADAKKDHYSNGKAHRGQSNNTLMFSQKPARDELKSLFERIVDAGGSEPGFYNAEAALKRAPWFKGTNPCGEILLSNKNYCNLIEVNVSRFNGDFQGLCRAMYLAARANYRQACVDLAQDPILQRAWHEINEFLRLTGAGITGVVGWEYCPKRGMEEFELITCDTAAKSLRDAAQRGAHSMADELGTPRSKAVTTVKPSGTLGKIMDATEGAHKPLAKYIINYVNFSTHDPLVGTLRAANYEVKPNPYDTTGVLVGLPVSYESVEFDKVPMVIDGVEELVEVNLESAIDQLERYKWLMENYVDHNCSVTISYDPSEVPVIIDWLLANWDSYVGVSWLFRNDPSKTAEDLGYPYLPQTVTTKAKYEAYVSQLLPINIDQDTGGDMLDDGGCATGACPIR